MHKPTIHANICETEGGPYYQTLLHVVPHVGEYIELYSFVDQVPLRYQVVSVVHRIHDVTDQVPLSKDGAHEVSVYVKRLQAGFPDSAD